jgi:hypothetical protein
MALLQQHVVAALGGLVAASDPALALAPGQRGAHQPTRRGVLYISNQHREVPVQSTVQRHQPFAPHALEKGNSLDQMSSWPSGEGVGPGSDRSGVRFIKKTWTSFASYTATLQLMGTWCTDTKRVASSANLAGGKVVL